MKLQVDRYSLSIIPENVQDEAYIEEVLGLKRQGDRCQCFRVNAMGLSALAYIQLHRDDSEAMSVTSEGEEAGG